MHVCHGVDPDRLADHAIREYEWKTAHDATTDAMLGPRCSMGWGGLGNREIIVMARSTAAAKRLPRPGLSSSY
jgi:hypothetical protein